MKWKNEIVWFLYVYISLFINLRKLSLHVELLFSHFSTFYTSLASFLVVVAQGLNVLLKTLKLILVRSTVSVKRLMMVSALCLPKCRLKSDFAACRFTIGARWSSFLRSQSLFISKSCIDCAVSHMRMPPAAITSGFGDVGLCLQCSSNIDVCHFNVDYL